MLIWTVYVNQNDESVVGFNADSDTAICPRS